MIGKMSHADFVERFGGVYEHSAWIAAKCFEENAHLNAKAPVDLAGPMAAIVEAAPQDAQLTLLRSHPDLAGKLAKSGALTAESTSEQAGAGLDDCTEAEFSEFTQLNKDYREKFGFPYILAVKGRHRTEILENFRARLANDMATEFREALSQVHQIARLRLQAMSI